MVRAHIYFRINSKSKRIDWKFSCSLPVLCYSIYPWWWWCGVVCDVMVASLWLRGFHLLTITLFISSSFLFFQNSVSMSAFRFLTSIFALFIWPTTRNQHFIYRYLVEKSILWIYFQYNECQSVSLFYFTSIWPSHSMHNAKDKHGPHIICNMYT